jgi:hypothetical protein
MKRILALALLLCALAQAQTRKWTPQAARDWYARQGWLVGANYVPSYAVNQIEMWQADSFDPIRIDMELGWAEDIGMNTMRVFLHDLLWKQDAAGFKRRIDRFLRIAERHNMKILFVLFDSCWDPYPEAVKQREPRPGVHNSRWVQGPGAKALADPRQADRLLEYTRDVVQEFSHDKRILGWDLWNEPDNLNESSYGTSEPANKTALVAALLPRVAQYARAGLPSQPLTTGLWKSEGDWSAPGKLSAMERLQIDLSDVLSFHNYAAPEEFTRRAASLKTYNLPVLCTEYMARGVGSTFEGILPIAKKEGIAAFNWGLVQGKSQTYLPWDSWQQPYIDREPEVWFHDVFTITGKPYRQRETDFIREITGRVRAKKAA